MPRTFPELLQAMKKIAEGTPEASALIKRFEERAIPIFWDQDGEFKADNGFVIESVGGEENAVVVLFLPEGIEPPEEDAIAWYREAFVGEVDGSVVHVLFVDAVPCHEDWVAMKALYEIGRIEIVELEDELRGILQPKLHVSDELLNHYLIPSVDRARCAHEQMMIRILDRRLGGRLANRVRTVVREERTKEDPEDDSDSLVQRLTNEIFGLIPSVWPPAASADEREVRGKLVRNAVSMIVDVIESLPDIN